MCPFHDDTHPSAYINTEKEVFHCFSCGVGYSEAQFFAKINGVDEMKAKELLNKGSALGEWEVSNQANLWSDTSLISKLHELGWENKIIDELKLGKSTYGTTDMLAIPIIYKNTLLGYKQYNVYKKDGVPKMICPDDCQGYLIPFDNISESEDDTVYILEGEKDMITARNLGINAATLGSALSTPNKETLELLKNKKVVICYDNDSSGVKGMNLLASKLKGNVASLKYIKIGEVCKEPKEDFYDFITKYNCDDIDFYAMPQYEFENEIKQEFITLRKALQENILNKEITSIVTVSSEYSDQFVVPTSYKVIKLNEEGSRKEQMVAGEEREWVLEESKLQQLLKLIEVDAKSANVRATLLSYMNVSPKEPCLEEHKGKSIVIYKSAITDRVSDGSTISVDLYSTKAIVVGNQYRITYKLVNHPSKNQKVVAITNSIEPVDATENYKTDKSLLSLFRTNGTVEQRLDYLYQSAKHYVAKHMNYNIWLMSEMVFNSILDINYNGLIRGALDIFILGDTQVGKSETTSKLTKLYNFGQFLSLKTSTTIGLIGGSTKVDGSWCNTIGAIPKNNKKLVILEEFSGAQPTFIKTMTDIRSSNELRIARASGELRVPCKLRMITISNPINDAQGNPRFLASFPNGVKPLMELITSAEDVARYDGFLLAPKVDKRVNPFTNELIGEPIKKEAYEHKAEWVTTRSADNVIFAEGVESYIWTKAEELNTMFECNFPVFGTTTSLKLARFSVALASLLMNVDDGYENIIVTKEIVDYITKFLISIYTENHFRLDAYKKEYDSYNALEKGDIESLQALYPANNVMLDFLGTTSKTSRNNLRTISGLDGDRFNPIFSKLVLHKFLRIDMDNVYPTEKFRKAYSAIDKNFVTTTDSLIK